MAKKTIKKPKLPKVSTVRNRCDALLTPIVQKFNRNCLLNGDPDNPNCAYEVQVGHHHIHKGASTRLRYEISNIIPLCSHCHVMLHNNESFWASKIVKILGVEWFDDLQRMRREDVKADVHWYMAQHDRLIGILNEKN